MKKILVSGANPAWQKVLMFKNINAGKVNRAADAFFFASGKGINFVRAVSIYRKANAELVQFLAGMNGNRIASELDGEGINHCDVVLANGDTRTCSTCIDLAKSEITELIEPSPLLSSDDIESFKNTIAEKIGGCDAFAICGTMPANAPNDIYLDLTLHALRAEKLVLVDMIFNLTPVLQASKEQVILKINADELAEYTGIASTVEALRELDKKYSLVCAAITDGPGKSYLLFEHKIYEYTLPKLEKVVNAIGCGDTASAVLLSEFMDSGDAVEAFKMALGCASGNCLSVKCGEYDLKFAENYAAKIIIKEI